MCCQLWIWGLFVCLILLLLLFLTRRVFKCQNKTVTKPQLLEFHGQLRSLLETILLDLEQHQVRYVLFLGTLLGALREGDFVPWDDNLTLAVMEEDWPLFYTKVKKKYQGPPFRLTTTYFGARLWYQTFCFCDFFFMNLGPKGYQFTPASIKKWPRINLTLEQMEIPRQISMFRERPLRVCVPAKSHEYLWNYYGPHVFKVAKQAHQPLRSQPRMFLLNAGDNLMSVTPQELEEAPPAPIWMLTQKKKIKKK